MEVSKYYSTIPEISRKQFSENKDKNFKLASSKDKYKKNIILKDLQTSVSENM